MDSELSGETLLSDLQKWVSAEALKIEDVEKYDLKIYGPEDKAETHGSDIAFVDISTESFSKNKKEYHLVIKYGQRKQRNKDAIRNAFEREIDVYAKLIPCFHKYQESKNLPLFNSVPKCYLTKFTDTEEVLILENLKSIGYGLCNRKTPMDIDHMKLVLETYAEWHALSFGLKNKGDDEFMGIIDAWNSQPLETFTSSEGGKLIDRGQQYLYRILEEIGERDLLLKYKDKVMNMEASRVLLDLIRREEHQTVVLHGDCWNNNFLFKYNDDNITNRRPSNVALLDFQFSSMKSPVFDLLHFIYAVAAEKELKYFKLLIDHYYFHLANYMQLLGVNPEKVFSYSDLNQHLKRYSAYGALINPMIMMFSLVDKKNAEDFEKEHRLEIFQSLVETEKFKLRVVDVARHFVSYEF